MDKQGIFKCLGCGHVPLQEGADAYRCGRCAAHYPVRLGVPLLLRGVQVRPSGFRLPRAAAARVCERLGQPDSDAEARFLEEVFAYRYEFGDLTLDAENNYFFNRIQVLEDLQRPPLSAVAPATPVNVDVRYEIVHHLVPPVLPRGQGFTRNVRLRNTGSSVLSSSGPHPVFLPYHWHDSAGAVVQFEGARSPLPLDLLPGRAVSVPVRLYTPLTPGPLLLELTLFQEGVGWLERDARVVGVQIVWPDRQRPPSPWVDTGLPVETYDYDEDHRLARELLFEEVHRLGRTGVRLLEVGGCCRPMTRGLPHEIYNVDIDVQTLQIGARLMAGDDYPVRCLAANVNDLPFAGRSFDVVVLFAALHHFPDPAAVLEKLKQLLKPEGFLAVLCEPVGDYDGRATEPFLAELQRGINEQIFTLGEYSEMFLQAGLFAPRVEVDRAPLKAILRPRPDPARRCSLARPGLWSRLRHRLRTRVA
jgi:SAM-dependent methyltransferase